jgi:hypothetical protein
VASDPGSPSRAPVAYTRKLADWRGLLTRNMEGGRDVRKAPLVGPLRFTPNIGEQGKRDRFTGGVRCPTSVADRALAVHAIDCWWSARAANQSGVPRGFVIRVSPGFDGFSDLRAA